MANIVFQIGKDFEETAARFAALKGRDGLFALFLQLFSREAQLAAAHITRTQLSGQPLRRRTGALARSMIGQVEVLNGVPAMRVGILRGPATKYAGIQEFGGKIVPKTAKALAIPVGAALTPAGVDRYNGPRNYPGELRFIPFRRGIAVGKLVDDRLASKLADPNNAEAVYLLLRSVTIRPKHYLRNGFQSYLPTFTQHASAFLKAAITNANK